MVGAIMRRWLFLLSGYQSSAPPVKSAQFLYIVSGALTQMQGQVPTDAFDGENGYVAPSQEI